MSARDRPQRNGRSGLYLAVVVLALAVAVYLLFQLIGFFLKLAVFAAVLLIAVAAWRAWRTS